MGNNENENEDENVDENVDLEEKMRRGPSLLDTASVKGFLILFGVGLVFG